MEFAEITASTLPTIRRHLAADNRTISEYFLSYTWPWRSEVYSMQFGETHGCGVYKYKLWGREYFSFPFGAGDKERAKDEIIAFAREKGLKPKFSPITRAEADSLGANWLVRPVPAIFDYVYNQSDLAELKGSKYQQKRNHIHRFEDLGPWRYGAVNVEDCRRVLSGWVKDHPVDEELKMELKAIERILSMDDLMGLTGGVLYSNEKPVAFALGEKMNDEMFLASYEKALPEVQGAFPMVNREFARREAKGFKFVNRASDDNHPNLAKAKRSYHPAFMVEKFVAVESKARFAAKDDIDTIIRLWREAFGDSEELVRFFVEHRLTADNCLLIDDKAMAFFLEMPDDTRYMYALCTAEDARGKGLATEIIRTAQQIYHEPITLVPGEAGLVGFYEKAGFKITSPACRRRVELDGFAREFYRIATANEDPEVFASGSTMSFPFMEGYEVAVPLN